MKPVLSKAKELMRSFTAFRMTLRVRFFAVLRMTIKKSFSTACCFLTMGEIYKTGIRYILVHGDALSYGKSLLFCLINHLL